MIFKFKIEQYFGTSIWYNFKFNGSDIKHSNNKIFVYMWDVIDTRLCRRWNKHDL